MVRVQEGCESSWKEFYGIYHRFIRGVARRAGLPNQEADDLVQKVFLELHLDFQKPVPPDFSNQSFGAWLGQKVKWRVLEFHRHRHRRETPDTKTGIAEPEAANPFDGLWDSEWSKKTVEVALGRIEESPRNLFVFQALAIQEEPVGEVCRRFGISRSNADTIKHRVKSKLKDVIEDIERGQV